MYYPLLTIDLDKIYSNTIKIKDKCSKHNIDITAITKCTGGNIKVAETLAQAGVKALGDSRLINLELFKSLNIPKWLIRIPMMSEAERTVLYSDVSLNSEIKVLQELNYQAKRLRKKHGILLMIDVGDLREGWYDLDDFYKSLDEIKKLDHLDVLGIGTNTNCAGALIPEPDSFSNFPKIIEVLREKFNKEKLIVSGGNSGSYYMIENDTIPNFINNLRLGEMLLFGKESSFQKKYDYLYHDAFKLQAEIIEIKTKPSKPKGLIGKDAFCEDPIFEDKGLRKRALIGVGRQDVSPENIVCEDKDIKIITSSSDHLITDITDSKIDYQVGDIVNFDCNYVSTLNMNTSNYVFKTTK